MEIILLLRICFPSFNNFSQLLNRLIFLVLSISAPFLDLLSIHSMFDSFFSPNMIFSNHEYKRDTALIKERIFSILDLESFLQARFQLLIDFTSFLFLLYEARLEIFNKKFLKKVKDFLNKQCFRIFIVQETQTPQKFLTHRKFNFLFKSLQKH